MAIFKCTWFWSWDAQTTGWTNNLYLDEDDYSDCATLITTLAPLWKAIVLDLVSLDFVRISDITVPGDSKLVVDGVAGPGDVDSTDHEETQPWSAFNLRVEGPDPVRRSRYYIHGVPRDYFTEARKYDPTNWNAAAVTAFGAGLIAGFWGFMSKRALDPSPQFIPISAGIKRGLVKRGVGRPFGLLVGRQQTGT